MALLQGSMIHLSSNLFADPRRTVALGEFLRENPYARHDVFQELWREKQNAPQEAEASNKSRYCV